jgi:hypothetical protein
MCWFDSDSNQTCADNPAKGKSALASPTAIFNTLYGEDLSEITQYGIDFALFGL